MKQTLLLILLIPSFSSLASQNIERIEVKGIILADNNDLESVAVYNTSSNKGTITNDKGEFTINVGLNDIVEVSALQFKAVSVTITKDVIISKLLKIYLADSINQLDAVLLSSGLSGNLVADINSAEAPKKINLNFNWESIKDLEFYDDKASDANLPSHELNKVMNKGGLYNGVDFVAIFGSLVNSLLKSKKKKSKSNNEFKKEKPKDLLSVYNHEYISKTFNIPFDSTEAFIAFVEREHINTDFFEPENELQLIAFLINQSELFLKLQDVKD